MSETGTETTWENSSDQTANQLAKIAATLRQRERWDKYFGVPTAWVKKNGLSIACFCSGTAASHIGHIAQAMAIVGGSLGMGSGIIPAYILSTQFSLAAAAVPPALIGAFNIFGPKPKTAEIARMRRRTFMVAAGLSAVGLAIGEGCKALINPSYPALWVGTFSELSPEHQKTITTLYQDLWLPAQPPAQQQVYRQQAEQSKKTPAAYLYDTYGMGLVDGCSDPTLRPKMNAVLNGLKTPATSASSVPVLHP